MEGRLLLDVVVGESATVLQLLSGEDQSLLIGRDTFLILNLGLDVFDRVRRFDIKSDGLASESLDEDLHTTSESEDEMESRLLLDVVVSQSSAVFELLSGKDQSLLIGRDTFLILNLGLNVLDRVRRLDVKSDGLASESLDEDLHTTSESEDEMESRLLLDVVVGESSSILELLSGENETLLIGRDTFLVLDLGLNVFDGVRRLDIEGNGLSSQSLDEDLHCNF